MKTASGFWFFALLGFWVIWEKGKLGVWGASALSGKAFCLVKEGKCSLDLAAGAGFWAAGGFSLVLDLDPVKADFYKKEAGIF